MNWSEACEEANYDPKLPFIKAIFSFYAYKDGKVWTCKTKEEAEKFSGLVERTLVNKQEIEDFRKVQDEKHKIAFDIWFKDLKADYIDLSNDQFYYIYNAAYERGHSAGYDEVAIIMDELYDFVKIYETLKGK